MSETKEVNIRKEYLDRMERNTEAIIIDKTYWKGVAYPIREIQVGNDIFRASVERLRDELVNDMRNGIYEAMEASEEIDGYCTDEELCTRPMELFAEPEATANARLAFMPTSQSAFARQSAAAYRLS